MISISRTSTQDATPPLGVDVSELRAIHAAIGKVRDDLEARTAEPPVVARLDTTNRAAWFAVGLAGAALALAVIALVVTLTKG